jgi:hypothetical protein
MRTRMVAVRGLATLAGVVAVVLSLFSGVARGDEDSLKIRWDIQHYPNFVLQPVARLLPTRPTAPRSGLLALAPLRRMGMM